jgi:hypothetical protein
LGLIPRPVEFPHFSQTLKTTRSRSWLFFLFAIVAGFDPSTTTNSPCCPTTAHIRVGESLEAEKQPTNTTSASLARKAHAFPGREAWVRAGTIAPTTPSQINKDGCTSNRFLRVCPPPVGLREGCCSRFPLPCVARPGSDQHFPGIVLREQAFWPRFFPG